MNFFTGEGGGERLTFEPAPVDGTPTWLRFLFQKFPNLNIYQHTLPENYSKAATALE